MKKDITNINLSLVTNFEAVIDKHFKVLGNLIGDYLILIELAAVKQGHDIDYVQHFLDNYALKADEMLETYKSLLLVNLENFVKSLTMELPKHSTVTHKR